MQKGQRTVTSLSAWGKQASEGEKTKVANDVKAHDSMTAPTYYIYVLYLKITIAWSGLVPCHTNYAVQSQESHFCNLLQRAPSSVAKIIAQKSGIQERRVLFFRPRGETTTCHNLKAQDFQVSKDFQKLSKTFRNFQSLSNDQRKDINVKGRQPGLI